MNNKQHTLYSTEVQEVVTSGDTFNFNEYIEIRLISFFYYTIFTLRFYRFFFQFLNKLGISLSRFALDFLQPDDDNLLLDGHKKFIKEIDLAVRGELFDTEEEVRNHFKELYQKNGTDNPHLINLYFGTKLIYDSDEWLSKTLISYFEKILQENKFENHTEVEKTGKFLIDLSNKMRINLFDGKIPSPIETKIDIEKWASEKFKKPIFNYTDNKRYLTFEPDQRFKTSIKAFKNQISSENELLFCYQAIDSLPRSILVYNIKMLNGTS